MHRTAIGARYTAATAKQHNESTVCPRSEAARCPQEAAPVDSDVGSSLPMPRVDFELGPRKSCHQSVAHLSLSFLLS